MYVCMLHTECIYVCMQVYQLTILSIVADRVCVCMHACMYVFMYVYMYACMYVCMYVCVCMYYVCTYLCMHVCMHVAYYIKVLQKTQSSTNYRINTEQIQMLFQVARQSYFDMNDILLGTCCHFLHCLIFISKRNNT